MIYPSDLYSMAGDTMEFAKPVIGIKEPAPANFPILLKRLSPVKKALIPIKTMETTVPVVATSNPSNFAKRTNHLPNGANKSTNPKGIQTIFEDR